MLILASQSTTRKALLLQAGLQFQAFPSALDERAIEAQALATGADGRDIAVLLARRKAEAISASHRNALVIGADQTLTLGARILHKPADRAEAASQLGELRGKTHRLHAAVCLVQNGTPVWSCLETAELTMRDFSASELEDVLQREGEAVLHSVGGYRLEGPSLRLFEAVKGDYFTILGLPMLPLLAALRQFAPETLQ